MTYTLHPRWVEDECGKRWVYPILIKPLEIEKTEGGVLLPDDAKRQANLGTVAASSSGGLRQQVLFSEYDSQVVDDMLWTSTEMLYAFVFPQWLSVAPDCLMVQVVQKGSESGAILIADSAVRSQQKKRDYHVLDKVIVIDSRVEDFNYAEVIWVQPNEGLRLFHKDFAFIPEGVEWRIYRECIDEVVMLRETPEPVS